MIPRKFNIPENNSAFLFGPRGTGKSYFLKHTYPNGLFVNLLDDQIFQELLPRPNRLREMIPKNFKDWIIIDEIQKIPELLDEVHYLIEEKRYKFILTGSSARKLRRAGVNLLAGRAYTKKAFTFSALELQDKFNLELALKIGLLPKAYLEPNSKEYLSSYITTYLKEEVMQEGLVRNLAPFARFLEAASFSQAQILNCSNVAADCSLERKTVANYFGLLNDLLLSHELEVFSRRAKRELIKHKKFYFFDAGIFKQLRPKGPLDSDSELNGAALETLVLQELLACNEYLNWNYQIFYWHTKNHHEVDFVLYGEKGFHAIEVKLAAKLRDEDFLGLLEFRNDYPMAKTFLLYGGTEKKIYKDIQIIPIKDFFSSASIIYA